MKLQISLLGLITILSCSEKQANLPKEEHKIDVILKVDSSNTQKKFEYNDSFECFNNWLKLGISEKLIIEKIGKPNNLKSYYSEVSGYNCKEYNFTKEGIVLILEENDDKIFKVIDIKILINSSYKLNSGVKIGNRIEVVKEKYNNQINLKDSHKDIIIIGDVYYGIYFYIHNEKVQQIQIGSLAE